MTWIFAASQPPTGTSRGAAAEVEHFWSMANPLPVAAAPPPSQYFGVCCESNKMPGAYYLWNICGQEKHLIEVINARWARSLRLVSQRRQSAATERHFYCLTDC